MGPTPLDILHHGSLRRVVAEISATHVEEETDPLGPAVHQMRSNSLWAAFSPLLNASSVHRYPQSP